MELFFMALGMVAFVGLIVGAIGYGIRTKNRYKEILAEVASTYGLLHDPGSFWRSPKSAGVWNGVTLTVDSFVVSTGKSSTTYGRVRCDVPDLDGITLKHEGVISGIGKLFTGDDIQVCDPPFDAAIVVRGPELELRSRLNDHARREILATIDAGTQLEKGVFRHQRVGYYRSFEEVAERIEAIISSVAALRSTEPVERRLVHLLRNDSVLEIRKFALRTLRQATYLRDPDVRAALDETLRSRVPELVVLAAEGRRDQEAVDALALIVGDPDRDFNDVMILLTAADLLSQCAPNHPVLSEAPAWIVDQLGLNDQVTLLAARTLGRIAGVEQVQALMPYTSGLSVANAVKKEAREAVQRIQGRASGDRGGLSVSTDAGEHIGEVSVAPAASTSGHVSYR